MLLWLQNNLATIIICILLLLGLGTMIRSMYKAKKSGASCCSGSCANCSKSGGCH